MVIWVPDDDRHRPEDVDAGEPAARRRARPAVDGARRPGSTVCKPPGRRLRPSSPTCSPHTNGSPTRPFLQTPMVTAQEGSAGATVGRLHARDAARQRRHGDGLAGPPQRWALRGSRGGEAPAPLSARCRRGSQVPARRARSWRACRIRTSPTCSTPVSGRRASPTWCCSCVEGQPHRHATSRRPASTSRRCLGLFLQVC